MSEKQTKQQQQDDAHAKDQEVDLDEMLKKAEAEAEAKDTAEEQGISRDEELEQAKDQAIRAMAELQNAKRRMEEDRQSFVKYASANLMTALLPVLDNFERAFQSTPEELKNNDWVKGMSQVEKAFVATLEKEGLEKIAPKQGDAFDANLHEGLMQDPNTDEGMIAQVLETGYSLKGKVLRPAKVSVGSK